MAQALRIHHRPAVIAAIALAITSAVALAPRARRVPLGTPVKIVR